MDARTQITKWILAAASLPVPIDTRVRANNAEKKQSDKKITDLPPRVFLHVLSFLYINENIDALLVNKLWRSYGTRYLQLTPFKDIPPQFFVECCRDFQEWIKAGIICGEIPQFTEKTAKETYIRYLLTPVPPLRRNGLSQLFHAAYKELDNKRRENLEKIITRLRKAVELIKNTSLLEFQIYINSKYCNKFLYNLLRFLEYLDDYPELNFRFRFSLLAEILRSYQFADEQPNKREMLYKLVPIFKKYSYESNVQIVKHCSKDLLNRYRDDYRNDFYPVEKRNLLLDEAINLLLEIVNIDIPKLIRDEIGVFHLAINKNSISSCFLEEFPAENMPFLVEQSIQNKKPLDVAIANPTYINFLLDNGAQPSLYHFWRVLPYYGDVVRKMLARGINPNAVHPSGNSPLMSAGDECVLPLLEYKADVDYCNPKTHMTALKEAAKIGNAKRMLILLQAGAKADITDQNGQPILWLINSIKWFVFYIKRKDLTDIVPTKELLRSSLDELISRLKGVHVIDPETGDSPLIAVMKELVLHPHDFLFAVVFCLLQHEPDLDVINKEGRTAIFYANKIKAETIEEERNLSRLKLILDPPKEPNVVVFHGNLPNYLFFTSASVAKTRVIPVVPAQAKTDRANHGLALRKYGFPSSRK